MMGLAMEHVQNYEAAFIAYLKGVDLQQDFEDTWYFLNNNAAFCLNQLRRYGEAERYCRWLSFQWRLSRLKQRLRAAGRIRWILDLKALHHEYEEIIGGETPLQ
jgi:tetratricopeptide (TPR) repeat protein